MLILSLVLLIISISILVGCSKNNLLQGFTKPDEHEDPYVLAQQYLDDGKYSKALSIVNDILRKDSGDDEALVIKGQALLGIAGADFNSLLKKIDLVNDDVTTSNFGALSFISENKLGDLYNAANILASAYTEDKSALIATGLACMLASVSKINNTFNPTGGTLDDPAGPNYSSGNINATWLSISPTITDWSVAGLLAIADATEKEDLRDTAEDIKADIATMNLLASGPAVSYNAMLNALGF